ncbi:MAG: hypothetical protein ACR2NX_15210 [Chthoniobacterales bacterium]
MIQTIRAELAALRASDDERQETVTEKTAASADTRLGGTIGGANSASASASGSGMSATARLNSNVAFTGEHATHTSEAIERSYSRADSKIKALDLLLPKLKTHLRDFFEISYAVKTLFIQIDYFYHLPREKQPHITDYIHRLCKDLPIYFKIATLRHASVLYAERGRQPIGAQERHDYQPINVDFTYQDFRRTEKQVLAIFDEFARLAGMPPTDFDSLFKGDGFRRLVLAGGGVPRDCLSLFLEAISRSTNDDGRIGKDDVRLLSFSAFERKIEDLKRDPQSGEQDALLKGIYVIRQFCLDKKTSIFFVPDRLLQEVEPARELIFRLLDYRIIHSVGSAFTHKSASGSYEGFMIDIGCYAHLRKLAGKMNEIDLAAVRAKEQMRSVPILTRELLQSLWDAAPHHITTEQLMVFDTGEESDVQ